MLYVTCTSDIHSFSGVKKKVFAQARVFSKRVSKCYCVDHYYGMAFFWSNGEIIEKCNAISQKDYYNICLEWINNHCDTEVYIRYGSPATLWLIEFLKILYKRKIKIVIEFPTYPYEQQFSSWRRDNILFEDRLFRGQMKQYIDYGVTYDPETMIFGIPVIELQNGIDSNEHLVKKVRKKDNEIVLIAVASMIMVHGYERIIKGMKEYYQKCGDYKIYFRLVGDDSTQECEYYKRLVNEYSLGEYITFYGEVIGGQLDQLYDSSDIGIGPLGLYKINNIGGGPIKTREYCIRGLPFIYGYEENGFNGNEEYVLKVSNDDSPIDMNEVIKLYERTCGRQDIIDTMRNYAENNCSWSRLLEPVCSYFNRDK